MCVVVNASWCVRGVCVVMCAWWSALNAHLPGLCVLSACIHARTHARTHKAHTHTYTNVQTHTQRQELLTKTSASNMEVTNLRQMCETLQRQLRQLGESGGNKAMAVAVNDVEAMMMEHKTRTVHDAGATAAGGVRGGSGGSGSGAYYAHGGGEEMARAESGGMMQAQWQHVGEAGASQGNPSVGPQVGTMSCALVCTCVCACECVSLCRVFGSVPKDPLLLVSSPVCGNARPCMPTCVRTASRSQVEAMTQYAHREDPRAPRHASDMHATTCRVRAGGERHACPVVDGARL